MTQTKEQKEATIAGKADAVAKEAPKTATPEEVAGGGEHPLGIRETIVETTAIPEGGRMGEYDKRGMGDIVTQIMKKTIGPQPILTFEEAKRLGPRDWRPFRPGSLQHTCIIDGRRFLIDDTVLGKVRNAGLIKS